MVGAAHVYHDQRAGTDTATTTHWVESALSAMI